MALGQARELLLSVHEWDHGGVLMEFSVIEQQHTRRWLLLHASQEI